MINYLIRRVLYAIPILVGVNVITFALFFFVNTPEDMARMQLGQKRVTEEAVRKWKEERGYDRPLFVNTAAQDIGHEIRSRMWPSFAIALPVFLVGMLTYITAALLMAFFRGSYIDFAGVVLCVF